MKPIPSFIYSTFTDDENAIWACQQGKPGSFSRWDVTDEVYYVYLVVKERDDVKRNIRILDEAKRFTSGVRNMSLEDAKKQFGDYI